MNKHISHKVITAIVTGTASPEIVSKARAHFAECDTCSAERRIIAEMYVPSAASGMVVSRYADERIAGSIRKSLAEEPAAGVRGLFSGGRLAIASSLAVIACVSIYLVLRLIIFPASVPIGMSVSDVLGSVHVDGQRFSAPFEINEHMTLRIGDKSHALARYKDIVEIFMGDNTQLTLDRASEKNGKLFFSFNLQMGNINAQFNHGNSKMEYSFTTPHARIDSIGTEFILVVDGDKTVLQLKNGTVRVTALADRSIVNAHEGNEYIITREIAEKPLQVNTIDSVRRVSGPSADQETAQAGAKKQAGAHVTSEASVSDKAREELRKQTKESVNDRQEVRRDGSSSKQVREQKREGGRRGSK